MKNEIRHLANDTSSGKPRYPARLTISIRARTIEPLVTCEHI